VMNHWYMVLVMPACGRNVICLCAAPDLSCQPTTLASVPGHHIFQFRGAGATELRHSNSTCNWIATAAMQQQLLRGWQWLQLSSLSADARLAQPQVTVPQHLQGRPVCFIIRRNAVQAGRSRLVVSLPAQQLSHLSCSALGSCSWSPPLASLWLGRSSWVSRSPSVRPLQMSRSPAWPAPAPFRCQTRVCWAACCVQCM
jgi:hypothetical protein